MTPDWTEIVECRETFDNLTSCRTETVEYLWNIQQFSPAVKKKRECIMHPRFFTVAKLLKLMTLLWISISYQYFSRLLLNACRCPSEALRKAVKVARTSSGMSCSRNLLYIAMLSTSPVAQLSSASLTSAARWM